jgi:hypothetical protein
MGAVFCSAFTFESSDIDLEKKDVLTSWLLFSYANPNKEGAKGLVKLLNSPDEIRPAPIFQQ